MKEILLPYILLIWLLVKLGILPWNLKTGFWSTSIGMLIALTLLAISRHLSPVDFTDSSTIKAPHAVVGPLLSQTSFHQIERIFVEHNERVKKDDVLYTLINWDNQGKVSALSHQIEAENAQIKAELQQQESINARIKLNNIELIRQTKLGDYSSQQSRDQLITQIESDSALIESSKARITSIEARIENLLVEKNLQSRYSQEKTIKAPFDGQVSLVNIARGSRTGNMHIYDTERKFLEFRVPDQSVRNIEAGQFAEFYVDAYPGRIFRARVHSVRTGTGEAQVMPIQGDQHVRQHVANNASSHGRTVILEFSEPEGIALPIGTTGSAWISARKPHPLLGFIDIIGGATVRLKAMKSYLFSL